MTKLVFHSSFPALWKWTTTLCGIVGAIIFIVGWLAGSPVPLGITIGYAVFIGLMFAVAVLLFPLYVLPDGIRCYNFWGLYRTLRWEEIATVSKTNMLGLPYAIAKDANGRREIWVPLYLTNMPGFLVAVRAAAGEEHMLAKVAEPYGS